MLDIRFVRENPDIVKRDLLKRNEPEKVKLVDELVSSDAEWRKLKQEADDLRHKRNVVTLEISELKKQGKDTGEKLREAKELPDKIKDAEAKLEELRDRVELILMQLPNILHDSVPVGKDSTENAEIRRWGKITQFDFELKPHGELIEELGLADFKSATKVSGAGFVYLKNELALLDISLQRFAIDFLMKKGFNLIEPPLMLRRKPYEGVVSLDDFEKVMYKIEGEESYLIATSEHPLVAMHMDAAFEEKELPVKYCGISPCFRREIGSHGVDTRGLFRMHQFNKVEQVIFCKPEESWQLHEEIQKNSEEMLQKLEIPYRVVSICTGDIGPIAAKKYDIEAWFPREKEYKEVTSASNCTSYQAVRLNIKFKKIENGKEAREYVHTLNNTGIATSRTMRAIIENYQNEDGSISVPKVLVQYMNGIKKIGKGK